MWCRVDESEAVGVDGSHIVPELGDGFLDVVEGAVGVLFHEFASEDVAEDYLKTGYIEHAIVNAGGELRQVTFDELAILGDGIATDDERVLLLEMLEGDGAELVVQLLFGDSPGDARCEPASGVMVLAPFVHRIQNLGGLVDGGLPLEDRVELLVGDDDPRFENAVGRRVESGHFKIYPAESAFGHGGKWRVVNCEG